MGGPLPIPVSKIRKAVATHGLRGLQAEAGVTILRELDVAWLREIRDSTEAPRSEAPPGVKPPEGTPDGAR